MHVRCTKLVAAAAALICLAGPACADVRIRSESDTGATAHIQVQDGVLAVRGWVDGAEDRLEPDWVFDPRAGRAGRLVLRDENGRIIVVEADEPAPAAPLIDLSSPQFQGLTPQQRAQIEEGLANARRFAAAAAPRTGPSDIEVESQNDATFAGMPARRYRYRTTYDIQVKVLGMHRQDDGAGEVVAHTDGEAPRLDIWQSDPAHAPGGAEMTDALERLARFLDRARIGPRTRAQLFPFDPETLAKGLPLALAPVHAAAPRIEPIASVWEGAPVVPEFQVPPSLRRETAASEAARDDAPPASAAVGARADEAIPH